jgi:iron complex transport system ATP-binding protein
MAVVPQETHLAFDYTVAEVAMMGRYAHLGPFEIEGPADLAVVDEALASTGTLELRDRPFGTLSGGEKQRVVIAAALAQIFRLKSTFRLKAEATQDSNEGRGSFRLQPEEASGYLLLDEPTASLDLGYQLEVADLLTRLHDERGVAIVISTHDLALAGALCERVLLIRDGTVVAEGTVDDALTRENVRSVYGVDVDVLRHPSGRRVLVPIGRSGRA